MDKQCKNIFAISIVIMLLCNTCIFASEKTQDGLKSVNCLVDVSDYKSDSIASGASIDVCNPITYNENDNIELTESVSSYKCGDNLDWIIENNELKIYGKGDMYDWSSALDVPWCKFRSNIKKVSIGENVTSIGARAIWDTQITEINIPQNIKKIGDYAIGQNLCLTNATIPATVTQVGNGPFMGCNKLESIKVDENNLFFKDIDGVMFNIDATKLIQYPMGKKDSYYEIPDGVDCIGAEAFYATYNLGTKLTSVYIPSSVKSIERGAFMYCSLSDVYYEGTEEDWNNISIYAANDALTDAKIHFNEAKQIASGDCGYYVSWTLDENGVLKIYGTGTIDDYKNEKDVPWYDYRKDIVKIVISSGVYTIGKKAFYDCNNLESIEIPRSVKTINEHAFGYRKFDSLYYEGSSREWHKIEKYDSPNCANIYFGSNNKFEFFKDNYSFDNSAASFGYSSGYMLPDSVFNNLYDEITMQNILSYGLNKWSGSCFGMAATCLAFYKEYNYDENYMIDLYHVIELLDFENLYDVSAPSKLNGKVKDVFTYYIELFQASQTHFSSALSKENMSCEANDWGNMDSLITAIEHFAKTGEDPIILGIFKKKGGHAVIPFDINVNSSGEYVISVYDNNYPNDIKYLTIPENKKGFEYDEYDYKISYLYEEDVYKFIYNQLVEELEIEVSPDLMEVDDANDKMITLFVNSDNVKITDENGDVLTNMENGYEVLTMDMGTDMRMFKLPYGEYKIENKDSSLSNFEVSAATSVESKTIEADGNTIINVGTYENTDFIYAKVNSKDKNGICITSINDKGNRKVISVNGTKLSVYSIDSNNLVIYSSENSVNVDGKKVALVDMTDKFSMENGLGTVSSRDVFSTSDYLGNTLDDKKQYTFKTKSNTCKYNNGSIVGDISFDINNNSGSSLSATVIMAVYDKDGIFKQNIIKNIVLGNDYNYIALNNVCIEGVEQGSYIKAFLWKNGDSMMPLAEPVYIEIN
jgi:hypothetical protein